MGHVASRCGLCRRLEPLGLIHLPIVARRPRGPVTLLGDRSHELAVRLWSKVAGPWSSTPEHEIGPDDHWLWLGAENEDGYGRIRRGRRDEGLTGPHRLVLELMDAVEYLPGTAPDRSDEVACHHCDIPPCMNPAHLYWATQEHNVRDMVQKRRHRWGRHRPSVSGRAYVRYLEHEAAIAEAALGMAV
jgi:hypothetical protein